MTDPTEVFIPYDGDDRTLLRRADEPSLPLAGHDGLIVRVTRCPSFTPSEVVRLVAGTPWTLIAKRMTVAGGYTDDTDRVAKHERRVLSPGEADAVVSGLCRIDVWSCLPPKFLSLLDGERLEVEVAEGGRYRALATNDVRSPVGELCREVLRLADLDDPPPPIPPPPAEPRVRTLEQQLVARVRAAPEDDDSAHLVYADWLTERGRESEADCIRRGCALARCSLDDPEFWDLVVGAHRALPAVDEWLDVQHQLTVRYRRGVPVHLDLWLPTTSGEGMPPILATLVDRAPTLRSLRLRCYMERGVHALYALPPGVEVHLSHPDFTDDEWRVVGDRVTRLRIDTTGHHDGRILPALIRAGLAERVRSLEGPIDGVSLRSFTRLEHLRADAADVVGLLDVGIGLRDLDFYDHVSVEDLRRICAALPLDSLKLGNLSQPALDAIAQARPGLRSLTGRGGDWSFASLVGLECLKLYDAGWGENATRSTPASWQSIPPNVRWLDLDLDAEAESVNLESLVAPLHLGLTARADGTLPRLPRSVRQFAQPDWSSTRQTLHADVWAAWLAETGVRRLIADRVPDAIAAQFPHVIVQKCFGGARLELPIGDWRRDH